MMKTPFVILRAETRKPHRGQNPSFGVGAGKDFAEAVDKTANALMNAQVAVYPIDESGLQKEQPFLHDQHDAQPGGPDWWKGLL